MHVSPERRDELILENLALVVHWAKRFSAAAIRARVEHDDLIQQGNLALIQAAEAWDPRHFRGAKFANYAAVHVCYELQRLTGVRVDITGLDADELEDKKPRLPQLVPLFPIVAFDPQSSCPHHRRISRGSLLVCMVCYQSGIDDHPLMQPTKDDPRPEPKPKAPPKRGKRETRRERRLRVFGEPHGPIQPKVETK